MNAIERVTRAAQGAWIVRNIARPQQLARKAILASSKPSTLTERDRVGLAIAGLLRCYTTQYVGYELYGSPYFQEAIHNMADFYRSPHLQVIIRSMVNRVRRGML